MDLAELKNIDFKDLVSKLKNSELLKDKKTLVKIGICQDSHDLDL